VVRRHKWGLSPTMWLVLSCFADVSILPSRLLDLRDIATWRTVCHRCQCFHRWRSILCRRRPFVCAVDSRACVFIWYRSISSCGSPAYPGHVRRCSAYAR
jgi:hypothetical protein